MRTRFTIIAALALISTPALAQLDYQTGGAADQAFHDNYIHNFGEPPNQAPSYQPPQYQPPQYQGYPTNGVQLPQ